MRKMEIAPPPLLVYGLGTLIDLVSILSPSKQPNVSSSQVCCAIATPHSTSMGVTTPPSSGYTSGDSPASPPSSFVPSLPSPATRTQWSSEREFRMPDSIQRRS